MRRHPFPAAVLAAAVLLCAPGAAAARGAHHGGARHSGDGARDAAMLRVDPATRVEQRCNARAMGEISREHAGMRPDELVAYAFADPGTAPAAITAPGGAVRSGGRWYHISYTCHTSADGMDVLDFSYVLGDEVPRDDWSDHGLVP